ncbi:MAG: hypothetical protein V7K41_31435 [Nostoc sp.]|uniref:hypothetical protein n=1 Tax=Nostoc sp. TaxID=1180 RepID=UPI002FF4E105
MPIRLFCLVYEVAIAQSMPIRLFCLVYEVAIAHRRCFTSGTECIHLPESD